MLNLLLFLFPSMNQNLFLCSFVMLINDFFFFLIRFLQNSFFDDEGNFVQDPQPQEVNPVISIPTVDDLNSISFDSAQLVACDASLFLNFNNPPAEMVQCPSLESAPIADVSMPEEKPKRQRKRKIKSEGVKTSLFEIPAEMTVIEPKIHEQSDHNYGSKPKRSKLSTSSFDDITIEEPAPSPSQFSSAVDISECDPSTSLAGLDKQSIRRIKNNVASKRSREQRKNKFLAMDKEAEDLEVRNAELREKIVELERLAADMKAKLVAKMAAR